MKKSLLERLLLTISFNVLLRLSGTDELLSPLLLFLETEQPNEMKASKTDIITIFRTL